MRAAALNHHDLWSLRGVGVSADELPLVLGTDAAGVTADGREVVCHAVLGSAGPDGDETLADDRHMLTERGVPGTFAERVAVPARNLVPKPPSLSFAEAACLPTAYLTAYRMLFTRAGLAPGAERAGAGRRRRRRDGGDRARPGRGADGLRDQPLGGEAAAGRGAGRRGGARARRAAAPARGRGDRDRRRGHLGPLAAVAAARRDRGGRRRHHRRRAAGRARAPLLARADRGRHAPWGRATS